MRGPQVTGVGYGQTYIEASGRAMDAALDCAAAKGYPPPNIWHFGHRENVVGQSDCWSFAVCAVGRL